MDITISMDTNNNKFRRFTSDKFSFNDYLFVSSCFQKEENDDLLKQQLEEDWLEIDNAIDVNSKSQHILDRVHHKININAERQSVLKSVVTNFSRIAAVLIIPALITILVLSTRTNKLPTEQKSWTEIYSPAGARTKFQLPDGTQGWLNGGSSIKYETNFLNNRKVEVSGEVWLDVVHKNGDKFKVMTPYFDVEVWGTRFNVSAYRDEATAGVILEKGKVVVLDKNEHIKNELVPNEQLTFDKSSKKLEKSEIIASNYTSWKDGLLIFKNEPMWIIAQRLERKYNTEIILHGDSLKNSIFRATFQDENLDEICKMLSVVAPISYKIHAREKQTDNTFTQSKVEIWLKTNKIKTHMPMQN